MGSYAESTEKDGFLLALMKDRGKIYGYVQPGSPAEYGSCCCHRRVAQ